MCAKEAAVRVASQCDGCQLSSIEHLCVRVSEEDRGTCQREPRYRRDPRLKTRRTCLTPLDMALLRRCVLLQGIEDEPFYSLINSGRVRAFHRGESLFHQGDPADMLYVLLEGSLKIARSTAEGVVTVHAIVEPGGVLGESSAFLGGSQTESAQAIWDCRLLEIPVEAFRARMANTPALGFTLAQCLSLRIHRQMDELESAYWSSSPQRLAAFLANLFPDGGMRRDTRLPYDKNVLAARLGMMPETLSRSFMSLRELGVRTHNRCVYVEDVERLRQYAQMDE